MPTITFPARLAWQISAREAAAAWSEFIKT
jgi:hypothetical protein